MKALTIWQPWATLIMVGAKPYEFRSWPAPKSMVGQRIVVHAGKRPMKGPELLDLWMRLSAENGRGTALDVLKARSLLDDILRGMRGLAPAVDLPLASGLGTVELGEPRRAVDLFGDEIADSDRIDQHLWGWPLADPQPFEPFVPMRGAQGFWEWPDPSTRESSHRVA